MYTFDLRVFNHNKIVIKVFPTLNERKQNKTVQVICLAYFSDACIIWPVVPLLHIVLSAF